MKKITIGIPEIAYIVVAGPTQCGKSIIMDRIAKMLEDEFGCNISYEDNRNYRNPEELADWERKMVKETKWTIREVNLRK